MTDDVAGLWKIPDFDPDLGSPVQFWNSTKRWPMTPVTDGVVFLPFAMHRIPRTTYPNWHSREPWIPVPPPEFMPRNLDTRAVRHIRDARRLLANFSDGFKPVALTNYEMAALDREDAGSELSLLPLSDDEWEAAHSIAADLRAFVSESRTRWIELIEGTFAFLRFGRLETLLRPRAGGDYSPAPAGIWNTELEQVAGRFAFGDLDLDRPFEASTRSMTRPHRIYVTLPSLERLLADLTLLKNGGQLEAEVPASTPSDGMRATPIFEPRRKGERSSEFKRRAMQAAWDEAFPDGIPGTMQNAERNHQLNTAIRTIAGLPDVSDRDWARLINGR